MKALDCVDLNVRKNDIVGLIGPNGSGKTTLFNCVMGVHRPTSVDMLSFNGDDIKDLKTHLRVQRGIARTFQLTKIYSELTVFQNLLIGQPHINENMFKVTFVESSPEIQEKAIQWLKFVDIMQYKNSLGSKLSYGQKKLLVLARAMMTNPNLLLLDEPTAGVNPTMIVKIKDRIKELQRMGMTLLIIEHNVDVIMDLCDTVFVLDHGKNLAEGTPKEIMSNDEVFKAYFGE